MSYLGFAKDEPFGVSESADLLPHETFGDTIADGRSTPGGKLDEPG